MLPVGFEWHPWTDSSSLHVNDRHAALCVLVSNGGCRIETGLGLRNHHITFQPSLELGRAYVEAWVQRWQTEIRVAYAERGSAGWPMLPESHSRRAHTAGPRHLEAARCVDLRRSPAALAIGARPRHRQERDQHLTP